MVSTVSPHMFIGRKVAVEWTKKGQPVWYQGTITAFDSRTRKHIVTYDDGEERGYNLMFRTLRWEDP